MSIIDSEEAASWPFLVLPTLRFQNIQNNADSVFIVISHNTLVGICRVGLNDPICFDTTLGTFMVRHKDFSRRLERIRTRIIEIKRNPLRILRTERFLLTTEFQVLSFLSLIRRSKGHFTPS